MAAWGLFGASATAAPTLHKNEKSVSSGNSTAGASGHILVETLNQRNEYVAQFYAKSTVNFL